MVKLPAVPHNTPKSDEVHKSGRSNSNASSGDRPKTSKHLERLKKRLSHGSDNIKAVELPNVSASKDIHEIHCSCDRLNNELFKFVDDFVDSQEYQDYLNFKKSVTKKDEAVQYDALDLVNDEVDISLPEKKKKKDVLRALSLKALRVFFLEVQIEKHLSNMKNAEILGKQEEAIKTIRQKIAELKCIFLCHREETLNKKKEREQAVVSRFIKRHHLDISKIISTDRLNSVILNIERKLRMKKRGHKHNAKIIVEKLLKEHIQNKKLMRNTKRMASNRREFMNRNMVMHIIGRTGSQNIISSVKILKRKDVIKEAFREAGVCLNESEPILSVTNNDWDKGCSTDFPYTTSDKSMQKSLYKNISNQISQEANAFKVKLDEKAKYKLGIMESFVKFEDLLEARHFFCTCERERKDNEKAEINYPDDRAFISNPDRIIFKDYKSGKIYTKKLTLRNRTRQPVRIRFFKIYCEDPKYTIYFEVDFHEIKIARPGLPVDMTIKFQPPMNTDMIRGNIFFLTCCESTYYRYILPIECFPAIFDVMIEPRNVNFGTVPIWKFLKNPPEISRFVKVRCSCQNAHKLIINKVEDPLELDTELHASFVKEESSSSSEESLVVKQKKTPAMLEMEELIKDILKEIDSSFHFDRKYVVMDSVSREQSLKITLCKIRNPGFYFEKYRVDIYNLLQDAEEYQGMQDIIITLEVPDIFIRCDPVCVDFGICFYGTAYQAAFEITNTSRSTHSLSVKIPSLLSYYVSLDETSTLVKSGERRRITVKLLPSYDFMLEKSKYFDQDTFILYFPIEIRLVDKKYTDVPPIMEHCYAIINDCSDLKVDPPREYFEQVDGRMALDMGECSVSESVTTRIVLRNSSYSKRYYSFINLPKWITIMPEYGFGIINAFQEIVLDIFIHPQVEDFKVPLDGDQDHFREKKNFTIYVETVANLGKYKRKPNMNRLLKLMRLMLEEMKSTTDIELLESIFVAKGDIRAEINLCTCATALEVRRRSSAAKQVIPDDPLDFKKEETDTIDISNPVEDEVVQDSAKLRKKKRKVIKYHSDEALRKSDSTDSSFKKRRKSSRHKNSSDFTLSPAPDTDEQLDGTSENTLERNPSLLDKKFITPMRKSVQTIISTNCVIDSTENLSRELSLKVVIVKPLYEFSFNRIYFPVTPGGSYSMMTTELRPLKFTEKSCACNSGKDTKKPMYRSTFRIAGSTEEIRIEPMYGVLEPGESTKLILIATPKMNDDVIAAYAYEGKKNALYDAKMEQELRRREEAFARKRGKSKTKITLTKKKGKKQRSVSIEIDLSKNVKEEEEINIEIYPEEVQVAYSDLYPAELALWRSIQPYFLNTNFVCRLDYETDEPWSHPPDIFSLETVCKVVSPDFIHDQKTQHLDFGQVPIGDCKRKIITIQNLKYHDITVITSILRPEGGFFCPNFDCVKLPSECFLKIPISYTPNEDESVMEFMEIRAERTVYRFLLSAEAAVPNIRLEPSSKIIRVVSKRGKLLELSFEIVNDSRQPVRVSLEKVCELEGKMIRQPTHRKSIFRSDRMLKKKTEIKNTSGTYLRSSDSPPKKNLGISYSDELTEDEIYSIENVFSSTSGLPYFRLSDEDTQLHLQESSKKAVKILFGPKTIENPKPIKKKDKRKSIIEGNDEDIGKTLVAKFNLLIGSSHFLRDFIIVGEFK